MEAMWSRFLPAVREMKRIVEAGAIGRVRSVSAELAYRKAEAEGGRFFDPELGGGASLDLGVYPLSLAIHLLGRPQRVGGRWLAARSGVDLRAEYELSFADAVAHLSCGFDRDGANTFLVEGDKGALRLEAPFLKAQRLTVFSAAAAARPLVGLSAGTSGTVGKILGRLPVPGRRVEGHAFPGNGLQFEARAVQEAVRAGRTGSDVAPLADSIAVLEAIGAVLSQPPR
jgi:predicted dehydrogenase